MVMTRPDAHNDESVDRRPDPPSGSDWYWLPARGEWVRWAEIEDIVREERALRFAEAIAQDDQRYASREDPTRS
jgi:hypothetical protein